MSFIRHWKSNSINYLVCFREILIYDYSFVIFFALCLLSCAVLAFDLDVGLLWLMVLGT